MLKQWKVGQTTILFTQKALTHVLQEHSREYGTDKARHKGKICFWSKDDVCTLGKQIVDILPQDLEFLRKKQMPLFSSPRAWISYVPFSQKWIVQLKPLAKNTFEIVSFYADRNFKNSVKK